MMFGNCATHILGKLFPPHNPWGIIVAKQSVSGKAPVLTITQASPRSCSGNNKNEAGVSPSPWARELSPHQKPMFLTRRAPQDFLPESVACHVPG